MTDLDLAAIRQRVHGINNGSHPVRFFEARDDLNALLAEIDRLNAAIHGLEGDVLVLRGRDEEAVKYIAQLKATIQRVRETVSTPYPYHEVVDPDSDEPSCATHEETGWNGMRNAIRLALEGGEAS